MRKRLVVGIDWFGPYSREEARKAPDWGGGLYLAIGKRSGKGVHARRPQYLGISKYDVCGRSSNSRHQKLRACYEPVASNTVFLSIRQTKATRCRPASVLA